MKRRKFLQLLSATPLIAATPQVVSVAPLLGAIPVVAKEPYPPDFFDALKYNLATKENTIPAGNSSEWPGVKALWEKNIELNNET